MMDWKKILDVLRVILRFIAIYTVKYNKFVNWQIQAVAILVHLKYVIFLSKLYPDNKFYIETVEDLFYHDLVLQFRYKWSGFCVRVEKCQVIRGYRRQDCDHFEHENLFDAVPEQCGNLAYGIPIYRCGSWTDCAYQIRCNNCEENRIFTYLGYKMCPIVWASGDKKNADGTLKYPEVEPKMLNLIAGFARDAYWRKYNLRCDAGHKHRMEFLRTLGYKAFTVRFMVSFKYQGVFVTPRVDKKPERPSTPEAPLEIHNQNRDVDYAYLFDNVDLIWDYGYNSDCSETHPDYEDWSWNRRN